MKRREKMSATDNSSDVCFFLHGEDRSLMEQLLRSTTRDTLNDSDRSELVRLYENGFLDDSLLAPFLEEGDSSRSAVENVSVTSEMRSTPYGEVFAKGESHLKRLEHAFAVFKRSEETGSNQRCAPYPETACTEIACYEIKKIAFDIQLFLEREVPKNGNGIFYRALHDLTRELHRKTFKVLNAVRSTCSSRSKEQWELDTLLSQFPSYKRNEEESVS